MFDMRCRLGMLGAPDDHVARLADDLLRNLLGSWLERTLGNRTARRAE
jgi:hypothetical protein